MVIVAFIFGLLGIVCAVVAICLGVYIAYRKWPAEKPIPDGVYHIRCVGRDRLTSAPQYKVERLEGDKEGKYTLS